MVVETTLEVGGCHLPEMKNVARLEEVGIGSSEGGVATEQFILMAKWHMKHKFLLTVLLIVGTMWIG